jgi:hypothetical protein
MGPIEGFLKAGIFGGFSGNWTATPVKSAKVFWCFGEPFGSAAPTGTLHFAQGRPWGRARFEGLARFAQIVTSPRAPVRSTDIALRTRYEKQRASPEAGEARFVRGHRAVILPGNPAIFGGSRDGATG